jgi:hypothetical protein
MIYVIFSDYPSAQSHNSLASVKAHYNDYAIFKQIENGVLCFRDENEYNKYIESTKNDKR